MCAALLSAPCVEGDWQYNALNGLSAFRICRESHSIIKQIIGYVRASSISTIMAVVGIGGFIMFQRPKRAFSISTAGRKVGYLCCIKKFQRPKRAFSISTYIIGASLVCELLCFNALNGLFPFLQKKQQKTK